MLLEYNLYENFNPNIMLKDKEPNGYYKGYPKPFARGVLLDYEVWQTGYDFTSSATMTIEAHVGDVVEVLLPIDNNLAISPTQTITQKLSIWYVITAVDESNKVTMQNYYWYSIEGSSYATANIYGYASSAWGWVSGVYAGLIICKMQGNRWCAEIICNAKCYEKYYKNCGPRGKAFFGFTSDFFRRFFLCWYCA